MFWRLILEEFGPNIQHIAGVDNIVAYTLSILTSTPSEKYKHCTRKAWCRANELFAIVGVENNEDCFLLNFLNMKREQQKDLGKQLTSSAHTSHIEDPVTPSKRLKIPR